MSGRDDDSGGFPHEIFEQMKAGHEKWMRELENEGWRLRQHRNGGDETRPPAMQTDDRPPLPNTGDRENFFVSFKNFVDNSLGSLADSFKSLPSNIQELRTNVQKDEGPLKERWWVKDWRRWTGREDTPEDYWLLSNCVRPLSNPDAWQAASLLLCQAHEKNTDVEPSKITDLYRDYVSVGDLEIDPFERLGDMEPGYGWGHLDRSGSAPSTLVARGSLIRWRWLGVDWFKCSMYSPFNLETHHLLKKSGHNWRAAFEDLLCASLDKPMDSNERYGIRPYGIPQSTSNGPALDWMLSLQCRGILPPQLPTLYGSVLDGSISRRKQAAALAHQGQSDYHTSVPLDSPIGRDMAKLAGEIATPGPEAQPQKPQQPQTELDLYLPPHSASPHGSSDEESEREWFREQQRCDAEDELWDALSRRDVDAAAQCMSDWHLQQRRLGELFGLFEAEDMQEIMPTLSKALQNIGLTGEEDGGAERLQQEAEALGLRAADVVPYRAASDKKVDVLSSLTTTQTTRLPDGTVTTKVILKQRFADGREETEEKLHTYHDPSQLQQAEEAQRPEQAEKKKGWFWS